MRLWHAGCGVMLLGVVLTLGSCGLFGLAINRQLEQRQIVGRDLSLEGSSAAHSFQIDEDSRLRLQFEVAVEPGERDLAEADTSSTIAMAQLPVQYRLLDGDGSVVDRGAGNMSGSEIIPEADRRDGSPFGEEISLNYQSGVIEVMGPDRLTVEVDLPAADDDGRELIGARLIVYDRVGANAGGLAAGGLLSLIAGPFVVSVGVLLLIISLFMKSGKKD